MIIDQFHLIICIIFNYHIYIMCMIMDYRYGHPIIIMDYGAV